MEKLTADYWEDRWQHHQTGWDIGQPSPPLVRYMAQVTDKTTRILIPGAGRAHEALHLHAQGFEQVYVCDWAPSAFEHLQQAAPNFPEAHLLVGDFFQFDFEDFFDLQLEQTFFCAIDPALRDAYVAQSARMLRPGGRLAGVLFAREFASPGPPFGGTEAEYLRRFSAHFTIAQLAISPDSVAPRLGNEFFIELLKA